MIKEKFDLTGKVAIITGASKGIGEAMARGMAELGATVVVSSRKQEAVDAVAKQFKSEGLSAIGIECHVGKQEDREALVNKVVEQYGRIDILVNNAGTNPYYGLGKNQAIEWGKYNIRVNTICPGYVRTKLTEALFVDEAKHESLKQNAALGRYATPDEMAGLALFLASDAISYMTGSTIVNDGGLLQAPLF